MYVYAPTRLQYIMARYCILYSVVYLTYNSVSTVLCEPCQSSDSSMTCNAVQQTIRRSIDRSRVEQDRCQIQYNSINRPISPSITGDKLIATTAAIGQRVRAYWHGRVKCIDIGLHSLSQHFLCGLSLRVTPLGADNESSLNSTRDITTYTELGYTLKSRYTIAELFINFWKKSGH